MSIGPECFLPKIGNGYIPTTSLREILAALDENLTSEQLDGIIAEIDTDGSGTVDFDGIFRHFILHGLRVQLVACKNVEEAARVAIFERRNV